MAQYRASSALADGVIAEGTISSGTSFDIIDIPPTFLSLEIMLAARTDRSGQPSDGIYLYMGSGSIDTTGANYHYAVTYNGTSSGALTGSGTIRVNVGAAGGSAGTDERGMYIARIINYADGSTGSQAQVWSGIANSAQRIVSMGTGEYHVKNVVNQLRIASETTSTFTGGNWILRGVRAL